MIAGPGGAQVISTKALTKTIKTPRQECHDEEVTHTKPVKDKDLFEAISRAEARDAESRRLHSELESIQAKIETLTPREREVLVHVVAGRLNKQIAGDLGTVEKTIKVHRSRMMEKLGIRTVADLVRMAEKLNLSK